MTDPRPRLTMATAKVGARVVCVDGRGTRAVEGRTYTLDRLDDLWAKVSGHGLSGWWVLSARFVLADPPALPAMTPELVAVCRKVHTFVDDRKTEGLSVHPLSAELHAAIAACPGLLAPPPPRTTDATFWLGEAA